MKFIEIISYNEIAFTNQEKKECWTLCASRIAGTTSFPSPFTKGSRVSNARAAEVQGDASTESFETTKVSTFSFSILIVLHCGPMKYFEGSIRLNESELTYWSSPITVNYHWNIFGSFIASWKSSEKNCTNVSYTNGVQVKCQRLAIIRVTRWHFYHWWLVCRLCSLQTQVTEKVLILWENPIGNQCSLSEISVTVRKQSRT